MGRLGNISPWTRARSTDQNTLRASRTLQELVVDDDKIASILQCSIRVVLFQTRIAIHDAKHFDVVADEGHRSRTDHGIRSGGRSAGKENRGSTKMMLST